MWHGAVSSSCLDDDETRDRRHDSLYITVYLVDCESSITHSPPHDAAVAFVTTDPPRGFAKLNKIQKKWMKFTHPHPNFFGFETIHCHGQNTQIIMADNFKQIAHGILPPKYRYLSRIISGRFFKYFFRVRLGPTHHFHVFVFFYFAMPLADIL